MSPLTTQSEQQVEHLKFQFLKNQILGDHLVSANVHEFDSTSIIFHKVFLLIILWLYCRHEEERRNLIILCIFILFYFRHKVFLLIILCIFFFHLP